MEKKGCHKLAVTRPVYRVRLFSKRSFLFHCRGFWIITKSSNVKSMLLTLNLKLTPCVHHIDRSRPPSLKTRVWFGWAVLISWQQITPTVDSVTPVFHNIIRTLLHKPHFILEPLFIKPHFILKPLFITFW
jgi:hypothetical protein